MKCPINERTSLGGHFDNKQQQRKRKIEFDYDQTIVFNFGVYMDPFI